ncbi:MAG: DnaJ domain-containing protein [Thermoproteota archaeon]|nr:DnaJ domain-containing protein [Thermoproteota archaeon]
MGGSNDVGDGNGNNGEDDYYKILGVLHQADSKEIKNAYRLMAKKYHPDRNSTVSDNVMKKINIAFEVLSDPEKRKQYDLLRFGTVSKPEGAVDDASYAGYPTGNISGHDSSGAKYTEKTLSPQYDYAIDNNNYSDNGNIYGNESENYYKHQKTGTPSSTTNLGYIHLPKGRYQIIVEPSLCMAFCSCETLAPKVFVVEKDKRINPKAIVISETGEDFETILDAAQTCPTKAIIIIDRYSGERIYP